MVHFNELSISDDSQYLIIDASIDSDSCFDDVILDTIVVDTQNTYMSNGPSPNPVININVSEYYKDTFIKPNCKYDIVYTEPSPSKCYTYDDKNIRVRIKLKDYGIKDTDILFVYILTSGTPSCSIDKSYILGTVINLYTIYAKAMNYIRELECNCSIPRHFIDFILRFKALELSVKTGNYVQAIKYWNMLNTNLINKNCYG